MNPLVSVLVPTYQHVPFIKQCLEGILVQRVSFNVEILVGEDGSTDGTREVCMAYATRHPDRIRLILGDRKDVIHIMGHPSGRANILRLLAAARGRYIALCEGDDLWTDPQKLARQVAVLEADPAAAGSFHATRIIEEDGTDTGRLMREHMKDSLTLCDLFEPLVPFHTSSFLFRNAPVYHAMPGWTHRIGALDLALFALAAHQGTLRRVEGVMSAYRKHAGGTTLAALHNGAPVNYLRGLVWLHLDEYTHGRCAERAEHIVLLHWQRILNMAGRAERWRYLRGWLTETPAWWLRRPVRLLGSIRDILLRPVPEGA